MKSFFGLSMTAMLVLYLLAGCAQTRKATGEPRMRHGSVFMPPMKTKVKRFDQGVYDQGQRLYAQHCLGCHGVEATGKGPRAAKLKTKPANLRKIAGTMPDIHFFIQIDEGPADMPSWRDLLQPDEMQALTHYIQNLK